MKVPRIPNNFRDELLEQWAADLATIDVLRTAINARLDASENGTDPDIADAQLVFVLHLTADRDGTHYER